MGRREKHKREKKKERRAQRTLGAERVGMVVLFLAFSVFLHVLAAGYPDRQPNVWPLIGVAFVMLLLSLMSGGGRSSSFRDRSSDEGPSILGALIEAIFRSIRAGSGSGRGSGDDSDGGFGGGSSGGGGASRGW